MKKFLIRLAAAALGIFLIWNLYIFLKPPMKTQMIRYGTLEDASVHEALIIREETVINAGGTGVLESMVREHQLVKNGRQVATVYQGTVDTETQQKLKLVNDRITEISNTLDGGTIFDGDAHKLDQNIAVRASDLVVAAGTRNAVRATELREDLNKLMDKKRSVSGQSGTTSAILEQLRTEKQQYESMLSATRQPLYAPKPGLYSTAVDGFEEALTPAAIGAMTVTEFKTLQKTQVPAPEGSSAACKVMSNVEWSVAMLVDADEAGALQERMNRAAQNEQPLTVYLRLEGQTTDSAATVAYISPSEGNQCVVIATATDYNELALTHRKCSVTLVRAKYEGLKVPIEAIRVKDGAQGVYAVTDGLMKFKKADILFSDAHYAVLRENNTDSGSLLLYDEVVLSAKSINEGAMVR